MCDENTCKTEKITEKLKKLSRTNAESSILDVSLLILEGVADIGGAALNPFSIPKDVVSFAQGVSEYVSSTQTRRIERNVIKCFQEVNEHKLDKKKIQKIIDKLSNNNRAEDVGYLINEILFEAFTTEKVAYLIRILSAAALDLISVDVMCDYLELVNSLLYNDLVTINKLWSGINKNHIIRMDQDVRVLSRLASYGIGELVFPSDKSDEYDKTNKSDSGIFYYYDHYARTFVNIINDLDIDNDNDDEIRGKYKSVADAQKENPATATGKHIFFEEAD